MYLPSILIFSVSLILSWIIFQVFGQNYALDKPNSRKGHIYPKPQIGGLVFAPLLLLIGWWLGLAPGWYITGGLVSIVLGATDDLRHIPWQIKLTVQLLLVGYVASIFWGRFDTISFYYLIFPVSQLELTILFVLWFVGIYNAVNLLDGLDGLAGGYILLLCIGLGFSSLGAFAQLNIIFISILLGFLVFNQRPAKLFMGDAGSLFLGFHTAVLPLLFVESIPISMMLDMTPFVILTSYLVADTARVFFTRLAARKSPMTADTIHFHHLILQQSGSYLASIGSIYIITLISAIIAVFSFNSTLTTNIMLSHFALLLLFILTPPVQTYVPMITRLIRPFYTWQKNHQTATPFLPRTFYMVILLIGLIISLCVYSDLNSIIKWQNVLAIILLAIFIFFSRKSKRAIYVAQLGIGLFFVEIFWDIEIGIFTKLFSTMLNVSYLIFILERRFGCDIRQFSSLDILMILITSGGLSLSLMGFTISSWFSLTLFSLWFSVSFILRRTVYFNS